MTPSDYVRVFDSQGEDYKKAFQVFLDSTDQKRNAKRFLQKLVDDLLTRKVFIDAGAGTGEVTKSFAPFFERTIAIEPNVHLLAQLQGALPQADAIATSILDACPAAPGDLVLCSHTLYYIPASEWLTHLERLVGWMSSTGLTVVIEGTTDLDGWTEVSTHTLTTGSQEIVVDPRNTHHRFYRARVD